MKHLRKLALQFKYGTTKFAQENPAFDTLKRLTTSLEDPFATPGENPEFYDNDSISPQMHEDLGKLAEIKKNLQEFFIDRGFEPEKIEFDQNLPEEQQKVVNKIIKLIGYMQKSVGTKQFAVTVELLDNNLIQQLEKAFDKASKNNEEWSEDKINNYYAQEKKQISDSVQKQKTKMAPDDLKKIVVPYLAQWKAWRIKVSQNQVSLTIKALPNNTVSLSSNNTAFSGILAKQGVALELGMDLKQFLMSTKKWIGPDGVVWQILV